MLSNRVLSIRISGKEEKERVRKLIFNLVHFRNLLMLFIRQYKDLCGYYPTDISILYRLIADREYPPKIRIEEKLKKFQAVKGNIQKGSKLTAFLADLKR